MNLDIKIKNIFLLGSQFLRGNDPNIDENKIYSVDADVKINYDFSPDGKRVGVMFTYEMEIPSQEDNSIAQISYSSMHFAELIVDNYNDTEEDKKNLDKYININVAAMVFPFVREHLATTTMKSGITPIIIPPINFVEKYKEISSDSAQ